MIYNCPKQLIEEGERIRLLLFNFCKTDEEIDAYRREVKAAGELKQLIENGCNLMGCRAKKKVCDGRRKT